METDKVQVAHPWWQPGVFASAPAIFLWICAELPPDMLSAIFHAGTSPKSLSHIGDTLFVIGWTASGVLMWHGRRGVVRDGGVTEPTVEADSGPALQAHGLSGLRQSMARRWERMRHPIPLH
ncbi:hypothetical protein GJQ57_20470 [Ralstonia pickettii]|uniref:Uncharacterized protein n=1 Tax=Ralstonia pickettii TaxID=329 RepID=A0A7X2HQW1_RALPI|nr:hypothetical protein [Ralstonia pickettii]MRT01024.1 hypothetical protein [Ralstonia pickettii]